MAVVVYILFATFAFFAQPRMVYYPYRDIDTTPAEHGMEYEDVYLPTDDGIRIHGWWIPRENAQGTVLFLHGNAGNISHRMESIQIFHDLQQNVFIIDYHGFGQSDGSPSEQATYQDAAAAWHYLTGDRNIKPSGIVVFGRSLGGGVATWLVSQQSPAGVILESTFTDLPALGAHHYPFLPVRLLSRYRYDNMKRLSEIRVPVLIAHSPDDHIVPYEQGQQLFAAANQPKQFLEMKGDHNNGFVESGSTYRKAIKAFLDKTLLR